MKHIIISTVMIMFASQASVGQTLKTYSGLYEGGQATYTYFEDENGERIKHGKFTYNKKNNGVEAILDKIIPYTETKFASGNYNNGVKEGKWMYKSKIAGKDAVFSDFSVTINYMNGRMEGTLNNGGELFQMKNNRITGPVKKNNKEWNISGQFDEDGFPDGTWTKKYQSGGNLYVDTEKYVHGLLIDKQTKNESTGEITRYEFKDIDPREYIAAHEPGKDSTVVGKLICQEKIYFKQGGDNYPHFEGGMLPEVFAADIVAIVEKIKEERGFGTELNTYDGIPFKEIVPTGTDEAPDEGVIFDVVEQMPQFPGGETKLNEYVSTNLKYPEEARKKRIQGKVFVAFVVNSDGSISETQIVRGIEPSCDKEALRLINNMPRWIPGQSDRKKVRTRYTLPIVFRIN